MDLVVVPGSNVRVDATAWHVVASAVSSQELWDLLYGDELFERGQKCSTNDFDFATRLFVEEALNNCPNSTKQHRGIHYE